MAVDAVMIREEDNVATSLRGLKAGEASSAGLGETLRTMKIGENILCGHKCAVRDILQGEDVGKYGQVIGRATCDILAGGHAMSRISRVSAAGEMWAA